MDRAYTRHVGLGIAGALVTCTRDVATLSLWAAKAGSRTPLAAPLRRPARRLVSSVEHRGALNEARLLSNARHISAEWFARGVSGPLLDHVVGTLVETGTLERVLKTAAQQGAGARAVEVVVVEGRDALAGHADGLVDDAGDRSRDVTATADDRGFEDGVTPA